MFTPRWSNISVALTIAVVAVAAFYAGRRVDRRPVILSRGNLTVAQSQPGPEGFARDNDHALASDLAESQDNWQRQWSEFSRRPATPAGEQAMARAMEELASVDPQRAISVAGQENNFRLRTALLRAALTGWGKTDPEAAATWAESQTLIDRSDAIGALLQGAVTNPERAIDLVNSLLRKAPQHSAEYGSKLISALVEAGQFEHAANFALTAPAQNREDWILPAYSRWAEFQPQAAAANAMQLADPAHQAEAMNAVIIGWSPNDPKGLIEFARKNLTASQQNAVVARALGFWANSDPVSAAIWIGQNDFGAASDTGIAEIAGSPQLATTPAIAASWAENIANPQLRLETLGSVLEQWATIDGNSAEKYLTASKTLAPDERLRLWEQLRKQ